MCDSKISNHHSLFRSSVHLAIDIFTSQKGAIGELVPPRILSNNDKKNAKVNHMLMYFINSYKIISNPQNLETTMPAVAC